MSKQKSAKATHKSVVIKMCKSHRISILILSAFLIICMLVAIIYMISLSEFGFGTSLLLCTAAIIPFLPLPLYYATWQITFNKSGIHKHLFWINQKSRAWTQVKEVRSAWLTSEKSHIVSIIFKDGKTIRFRMDCENAEKARKLILSHCSIVQ